jgi:hypothetical protein
MKLSNQKTKIVAFTSYLKINGEISFSEESRLTDFLNSKEFKKDFLAINNAVIKNLNTNEITKVSFLSLNKNSIEVIYEESN